MNEKPLVTIYTQGYNSEDFIGPCIESVINQTYTNFEYFVCNHGSKDKTLEIMREYEKLDSRIHVIDMPNSERGFFPEYIEQHGNGEYFTMLDSDDYWARDYLEKMMEFTLKYDLDMSNCGVYSFYNSRPNEIAIFRKVDEEILFDIDDNANYFSVVYNFLRTTWGKMIRMSLFEGCDWTTHKLNDKSIISSDTAFSLAIYEKCKKIGIMPECLIYYRMSDNSVTAKYNPALLDNNCNIFIQSMEILEHLSDNSVENQYYIQDVFWRSMCYSVGLLHRSSYSFDEKLCEFERYMTNPLVSILSENINISGKFLEELMIGFLSKNNVSSRKLTDEQAIKLKKLMNIYNIYTENRII